MLQESTKAPDFKAVAQDGKIHTLSDYQGKWILLYFYPKDDTPGCTKEACTIRDNFPAFEESNLTILGVSADSEESHKKFAAKYSLPFTILSDPDKEMLKSYEAIGEKSMFGKKYMGTLRISYLISPEGKIAKVYEKVQPAKHAREVLKDYKKEAGLT